MNLFWIFALGLALAAVGRTIRRLFNRVGVNMTLLSLILGFFAATLAWLSYLGTLVIIDAPWVLPSWKILLILFILSGILLLGVIEWTGNIVIDGLLSSALTSFVAVTTPWGAYAVEHSQLLTKDNILIWALTILGAGFIVRILLWIKEV